MTSTPFSTNLEENWQPGAVLHRLSVGTMSAARERVYGTHAERLSDDSRYRFGSTDVSGLHRSAPRAAKRPIVAPASIALE